MTATHHCKTCGKKTTHQVGKIKFHPDDPSSHDALRCVTCGNVVPITTHPAMSCWAEGCAGDAVDGSDYCAKHGGAAS